MATVMKRVASVVRDIFGSNTAYIGFRADDEGLICVAKDGEVVLRTEPWDGPGELGRHVLKLGESYLWRAEDSSIATSREDLAGAAPPRYWAGAPMDLSPKGEGVLAVVDKALSEEELELLQMLAGVASTAIRNLYTYQRTEALALTDELTRLYNFRFLKAALRREIERASRYGQVFSIIMIDVDHLKRYNDDHGHLGGSELLRQLAAILSQSSRAIDLVAKYGGDEFMVILPQTRLEGAVTMASRIRSAVASTAFPHCNPGDMTVSVGVASFPQHGDSVETLVGAADRALFQAKRNSRNCVVTAAGQQNNPLSDAA